LPNDISGLRNQGHTPEWGAALPQKRIRESNSVAQRQRRGFMYQTNLAQELTLEREIALLQSEIQGGDAGGKKRLHDVTI